MKRFLFILKYFFAVLTILVALLLFFSQTFIFKNWLCDVLEKEINENIDANLHIEKLSGNLFTHLNLSNIILDSEQDTLIMVNELDIEYSPLKFLKNQISINKVRLDISNIFLYQLPDSTWNYTHLMKRDSLEEKQQEKENFPFPYSINLKEFGILVKKIKVDAMSEILPNNVINLNALFSASYSSNYQKIELHRLNFETEKPDFFLKHLSFHVQRDIEKISLSEFNLRTGNSHVSGSGEYFSKEVERGEGILESDSLDLSEFEFILPAIQIPGRPQIQFKTKYDKDSLLVGLDIREKETEVELNVAISSFSEILNGDKDVEIRYVIDGRIRNFDLRKILNEIDDGYLLTGDFFIVGTGIEPENAIINCRADLSESLIMRHSLSSFDLDATYTGGDIQGKIEVSGPMGEVKLSANVIDLTKIQKYDCQLQGSHLNLAQLLNYDSLKSDLNFLANLKGENFNLNKTHGDIIINLSQSQIDEMVIDTIICSSSFQADNVLIERFIVEGPVGKFVSNGSINLDKQSDLAYRIDLGNISSLKKYIPSNKIDGKGFISGKIKGNRESFIVSGDIQAHQLLYSTYEIDTLDGNIQILYEDNSFLGNLSVGSKNISLPNFNLHTVNLDIDYSQENVDISLEAIQSDSMTLYTNLIYIPDIIPRIYIPQLELDLNGKKWKGGGAKTEIILERNNIFVHNFQMISPENDEQYLTIDGKFSLEDEENLNIDISHFEIGEIAPLLGSPVNLDGDMSLQILIQGKANSPAISGNLLINEGIVDKYYFRTLNGSFKYDDHKFVWDINLLVSENHKFLASGYVPMMVSFKENRYEINKKSMMRANFFTDGIPIGLLTVGIPQMNNLEGKVTCEFNISNTLEDPRPHGHFKIDEGSYHVPEYGMNYTDLQLMLTADSTYLSLDQLQVKSGQGYITGKGRLDLSDNLMSGTINTTQFQLFADKFYLAKHRDFNIQISADTQIEGNAESPNFSGEIKVLRSNFYVPAILKKTGKDVQPEKQSLPLLVEATQVAVSDSSNKDITVIVNQPKPQPNFIEKLKGTMKISLPRNTWLKGPNYLIELEGDLDLVKEGSYFELFGTIAIVRGNYNLIGRRFVIDEGRLIFGGGMELNPQIILEAKYEFRGTDKKRNTLVLNLSGEFQKPDLYFMLNGKEISQIDAVSYIMYGLSVEEIGFGQQAGLADGLIAMNMASSLVSRRLSKSVGQNLKLDYIELKAKDNWQSATFLVGKYITNELFVSYQREFGETNDNDVAPETITVEYELTKNIYLQLIEGDSKAKGVDLIFKIDQW